MIRILPLTNSSVENVFAAMWQPILRDAKLHGVYTLTYDSTSAVETTIINQQDHQGFSLVVRNDLGCSQWQLSFITPSGHRFGVEMNASPFYPPAGQELSKIIDSQMRIENLAAT